MFRFNPRHRRSHPDDHPHDHPHGRPLRRGRERQHGGYGGGREARVFDHGDLRLVIVGLLAEEPRYGYDIIKVLEERVGGGYSPSPGVVYPTLTLLEEMGLASLAEERGRKRYTLSPEGLAFLDENRAALNAILARTRQGAPERRGPPLPIARALENLATAVRLRFKGQAAGETPIQAAADAIDAAAKVVEGL